MTKCAFAPAHVSGLFSVHDMHEDPMQKGSRGGGWCLQHGAYAAVDLADEPVIEVNGKAAPAPVTQSALQNLANDQSFHVDLRLDLQQGQGFGLSAAGTLAACLAATSLLEIEPEYALQATHLAEIEHGSGLGDAMGCWNGGAEIRLREGCPPHGQSMNVQPPGEKEFLFCSLGGAIPTSEVIRDEKWKTKTRRLADDAVNRILEAGRDLAWATMLSESSSFSLELGLMPEPMKLMGEQLPDEVMWGQCMIGSTLWVTGDAGDIERAEALLEGHGPLWRSKIDPNGARLVRAVPPLKS